MNNLKRVLSLALASVMLIGMMAVSASATSFTDDADIENKEAVSTMVALNIIDGMGDGTYDPEGLLLREQAAKMVFVALNGGQKNDNLTTKEVGTFSDVKKGSWAEGYIEWCYNRGIIAGLGNGLFNPKGNLTGTQLAKIMLVAIGYDAKTEGLEGTNDWALNVNALALKKGFYKGLGAIDPEANITRDQAALLILNACRATLVEYDYKIVGSNGNIDTKAIAKDKTGNPTILTDAYDELEATGVLTATLDDKKGTYTLTLGGTTTFTKAAEDYADLLGENVTVLYANKTGRPVYGVFSNAASVEDTLINKLANAGLADANGATKIVNDGTAYTYGTTANATTRTSIDKIKVVDNDGDENADYVVVTKVNFEKVLYVTSTELTTDNATYKYAENTIADGLKKGDYVTVTKTLVNSAEKTNTIEKVEAVTGTVTGKDAGNTYTGVTRFQVGGNWYNDAVALSYGVKAEVTLYPVNGVICAGEGVAATASLDEVAMVVRTETGIEEQIKLLYLDGTEVAGKFDPTGADLASPTYGKLYKVTYDASKGYKLVALPDSVGGYSKVTVKSDGTTPADGAVASTTSGSTITQVTVDTYVIADDAIILAYDSSKTLSNGVAKVYTGKQLKGATVNAAINGSQADTGAFLSTVNGLDRVTVASVAFSSLPTASTAATAKSYGLVVSTWYSVDGGISYDIWNGTETVTVTDKTNASVAKGDVVKYSSIADGVIKDVTAPIALNTDYIQGKSADGKTLYLNGQAAADAYALTDDTVVMYFNHSTVKGVADGSIVLADKQPNGTYIPNVMSVVDADEKEIVFLLVDVKNDITGVND